MSDNALPPIPCPVCNDCDHDLRGGVLELSENIVDNVKHAFQTLLDAMEADGEGNEEFGKAIVEFASVRRQLAVVLETVPEIAQIKAAHA